MQYEAMTFGINTIAPLSNHVRHRLRTEDMIVDDIVERVRWLGREFGVRKWSKDYVINTVTKNISDTICVIILDHILHNMKQSENYMSADDGRDLEGRDKFLHSIRWKTVFDNLSISFKHLELLLECELADFIEHVGDCGVMYKFLRAYIMTLLRKEYYDETAMVMIQVVEELDRYSALEIESFAGCTITPDRIFVVFNRRETHGGKAYNNYSYSGVGNEKDTFSILKNR